MCEANVLNYNNAMNWYEFVALFYPDPDIRLTASWNYEEIEAILNSGNGGSQRDLKFANDDLGIEQIEVSEILRMNKIINDNPIMRKMKASFDKQAKDRKLRQEQELKSILKDKRNLDRMLKKANELDQLKETKAKRNILEAGIHTKEQADKTRMLDMMLTTRAIRNELESDNISSIPLQYSLAQNYPNPFNPTTTINFEIPKDELIKIKVYDITGREIMTLVNEFRNAGYHSIDYDGNNLSSGIYFYKLTAGNFEATKRMVLLK